MVPMAIAVRPPVPRSINRSIAVIADRHGPPSDVPTGGTNAAVIIAAAISPSIPARTSGSDQCLHSDTKSCVHSSNGIHMAMSTKPIQPRGRKRARSRRIASIPKAKKCMSLSGGVCSGPRGSIRGQCVPVLSAMKYSTKNHRQGPTRVGKARRRLSNGVSTF